MSITRRLFLGRATTAGAALATISAPVAAEAFVGHDLTAIPTDAYGKIMAWRDAHYRSVAACNAYSASLGVKPIDKAECNRCFAEYRDACEAVPPLREAMIVALLSVGREAGKS